MTPHAKLLALILDQYMLDFELAHPNQDTLAKEASVSRRTIIKALSEIEETGLIAVFRVKNKPNVYRRTFPNIAELANPKVAEPKVEENPAIVEILGYLNEKADKNFKPVDSNKRFLKARLEEGHSPDDIKAVIDMKVSEWKGDSHMNQYLRPATLFNAEKFNSYVGGITKSDSLDALTDMDLIKKAMELKIPEAWKLHTDILKEKIKELS
jgi:uncharacterized phage protein (TIGR02220 family)